MAKLWLLGEALIDFVPTQSDIGPAFAARPGGSPFNAAKAAAQAGADVGFLGAVSTDLFGEMLIDDLLAHNVNTAQTPRVDDPTTLAFVALTDGAAKYAFFNNATATALMAPANTGFEPTAGDVISFGSISLIDNPGADNLAAFALSHADKAMISIDPNARPTMTPDIAAWRDRIGSITDVASIIRLSDEDLELLAPGESPESYAQAQLSKSANLVVVTLGAEGVLGFCKEGAVQVPGQKARIVDTVGAGDTLMGSLLAELLLRELNTKHALANLSAATLSEILRYGVMASAINCESAGCAPPNRETVLARLSKQSSG